jgi:hypothetical protein
MRRLLASLALSLSLGLGAAVYAAPAKDSAVTILRVEESKPARLKLTAGSDKGVAVGTTGYLVDAAGKRVSGGDLKVVSVEAKSCVAEVGLPASAVDGSYGAVLSLP